MRDYMLKLGSSFFAAVGALAILIAGISFSLSSTVLADEPLNNFICDCTGTLNDCWGLTCGSGANCISNCGCDLAITTCV
jgi:hypothetical protein